MGEIKVAFGALEVARGDVVGTATRIAGRLDDLRRAVVPLAASWEGQAAQEYRARQRQWLGELTPRLRGIEAQEIDRLAHFEHGVDQGLSGLADAQ